MIKMNSKLLSYGETTGWLYPFDKLANYEQKCKIIANSSNTKWAVDTKGIKPLINSIILMMADEEDVAIKPLHLAIGTNSDFNGSETVYVEYGLIEDETVLVSYNPVSGETKGCIHKESTGQYLSYEFDSKIKGLSLSYDAVPLWMGIITTLMQNPAWIKEITPLKEYLSEIFNGHSPINSDEAYSTYALPICFYAGSTLLGNGVNYVDYQFNLKLDNDKLPIISKPFIEQKKVGPSKGKIITGNFKVFPVIDGSSSGVNEDGTIDIEQFKLTFTNNDFTEDEKMMIPDIPKDNVTPREAVIILNEMKDTWDKGDVNKITQILAEGDAGSGKSYTARLIAAVLKRPYISFSCSPNTDESDIKGMLLPVADTDEDYIGLTEEDIKIIRAADEANDDEIISSVATLMNLPTAIEISCFPELSASMLYGDNCELPTEQQMFADVQTRVLSKLKELITKSKIENNKGTVRYKYIPSPIVTAIRNGYFLELQEPSCMLQQGMLSCLFDVLDKDSIGIMDTPIGRIKKHPDFMIFLTTNRKYHGTKPLNEAFRSRFQIFLKMDSPNEDVITNRLVSKTKIDSDLARTCARIFKVVEETAKDINASGAATLRNLYNFADAMGRGKDVMFCVQHYLLWPITTDEDELEDLLEAVENSNILPL